MVKKHYSMTMQESFDQAIERGETIPGVASKVPQNIARLPQDKGRQPETEKTVVSENPEINSVCLAQSLPDWPLSYPARTRT